MRELTIGTRRIADEEPCFVIAEAGHNHGGDVKVAVQMIKAAAAAGASAFKLQKRNNQKLYSQGLLNQPYDHEHSYGKTYGEHRAALELGFPAYVSCRTMALNYRLQFFATAFDERSADFLMELGVPAIKIASGGLTDRPLLSYVSTLGVPIMLSTGGGTESDIDRAVQWITAQTSQLALLHCTAAYPVTDYRELNLRYIGVLRQRYPELVIGWSGHTPGLSSALIAYAFGARIIEMHFTLSRAGKGTDHGFSLEPKGLQTLVEDLEKARLSIGDGVKVFYPSERKPISKMRRTEQEDGTWLIDGQR